MTSPEPAPPLNQLFSLAGDVALVTGSARGLGFSMASALAEAGARVYLNGRETGRAQAAVDALRGRGLDAHASVFDVTDGDAAQAALQAIMDETGRLDILVNNVGARLRHPVDQISTGAFRAMLESNLVAPFDLSKRAAELMKPRGYGRILMITSVVAERGKVDDAAYIAAKGGMSAVMRAFACEWGPFGITCNAISPGRFATETNAEHAARLPAPKSPISRWAEPWEIGGACVFLASRAASFVTGSVLYVDGGAHASV